MLSCMLALPLEEELKGSPDWSCPRRTVSSSRSGLTSVDEEVEMASWAAAPLADKAGKRGCGGIEV